MEDKKKKKREKAPPALRNPEVSLKVDPGQNIRLIVKRKQRQNLHQILLLALKQ